MVLIKICGLKREDDIRFVNEYMPDFVGFVFAQSSRQVSAEQVLALTSSLDSRIKKVGVFVNEKIDSLCEIVLKCCLNAIQLHGDESPEYVEDLKKKLLALKLCGVEIWKAIRVKDESSLYELEKFNVNAFVLDTFAEGKYGGAGKVFDWELALKAKKYGNIILAGGLKSENVREAITKVQPFAVDVSSGVESEGLKDKSKIYNFINQVR